jgi:hypothetical protein
MEEMGCLAAKWVLDSLSSTQPPRPVAEIRPLSGTLHLLPPELVVRQSTARWFVDIGMRAAPVAGLAIQARKRRAKE